MGKDLEIKEVLEDENGDSVLEDDTDVLQDKLDKLDAFYDRVLERLEKEVQEDRLQAQGTYQQANKVVKTIMDESGTPQPSLLQALNGAMKNVQDSTQREYQLLQEVSKAKQVLEELQEMGLEGHSDEPIEMSRKDYFK